MPAAGTTRFAVLSSLVLLGTGTLALANTFVIGDETYGTSAIEITFSWDGNVNDAPTTFEWSVVVQFESSFSCRDRHFSFFQKADDFLD